MCPEEKELFSKSCFGQFLKQPKIIKSSKIINHLLMRVGNFDGIESDNDLYIKIDGEPRAFKGKQYAEIFGLRYIDEYTHCDYQTNIDGRLYEDIFHGGVVKNRGLVSSMLPTSKGWDDSQK